VRTADPNYGTARASDGFCFLSSVMNRGECLIVC